MKRLHNALVRIASTTTVHKLPAVERLVYPVLRAVSTLYAAAVRSRRMLYNAGVFRSTRLPVPVVSVGNLTWGGNGKTPMTEFLARCFADAGINPVILTRGYGGGDEARMLQKHFEGSPVRLGVGADRVKSALSVLEQQGTLGNRKRKSLAKLIDLGQGNPRCHSQSSEIGVAILDDGMQHLKVARDIEIVMVNAVTMFGNERMIPCGPLREPLDSLRRAQIIVVHHSNLVTNERLAVIKSVLESHLDGWTPAFAFSEMTPREFFSPSQNKSLPLSSVKDALVLCVSGVGCPESMSLCLSQLGALEIHRLDYPDHHTFGMEDILVIQKRISELERSSSRAVIVVTSEKDYFRHQDLWKNDLVLVLRSTFKILNPSDLNSIIWDTMTREL